MCERGKYQKGRGAEEFIRIDLAISEAVRWAGFYRVLQNNLCLPEMVPQVKREMAQIYEKCGYLREVLDSHDTFDGAVSYLLARSEREREVTKSHCWDRFFLRGRMLSAQPFTDLPNGVRKELV